MIRFLFLVFILFNYLFSDSIKVELQWKHQFEFAGFYAALEKGYYKEVGLDVELLERDLSVPFGEKCLKNEVQFFIAYSSIIRDIQNKKPYLLVANYLKRSPLALAVKKDILVPEDLKNKTIVASKEEIESANFRKMFLEHGIKEGDYNLIQNSMDFEDFNFGKVDAMSIYITNEPYYLRKKNIPFVIMDPAHYGGELLYDVNLVTTKNYAENHPKVVKNFVEATNKGWKYALDNKEEIVNIILKKYNTQHKSKEHLLFEAEEIEKLMEPDGYEIGSIDLNRIKKIEELYISLGDTKEFINPDKFVLNQSKKGIYSYQEREQFSTSSNKKISQIYFTEEEKKWLKKHPIIKVSSEFDWPPMDYHEEGKPAGYSIEYLNLIAKQLGVKFEFVSDKWSSLVRRFKEHEIDIIHSLAKTKELEKYGEFIPFLKLPGYFIIRNDILEPRTIEDLYGKTAIYFKGWQSSELLKKKYPQLKFYEVSTTEEGYEAVATGKADFLLDQRPSAFYMIQKNRFYNLKVAGIFEKDNKTGLHIAVRKDWSLFANILQKAMNSILLNEMNKLNKKWHIWDDKLEILSFKEREFLKNHGDIQVCADSVWQPLDYIDKKGKYSGVGAEFIKLFSKKIGHKIVNYPAKNWQEVLEAAKEGKCDIVSMIAKTSSREKYLSFTTPYFSSQNVIATREDVSYIEDLSKFKNEKFGIIRGYASIELLKKKYPSIKLVEVSSVKEGLIKVEDKEIFGFIDTIPTIAWHIQKIGFIHLKISGDTGIPLELSLGIKKELPILHDIFQKAVDSIKDSEKETILKHYINVRYDKGVDYTLLYKILIFILVVFAFILYHTIQKEKLNKELQKKVKEELEKSRQKDNLIFHQNKLVSMGEMIENIAHQWRQPLSQINASVLIIDDEISDKGFSSEIMEKELDEIEKMTKYMSQTIDDFRNLLSQDKFKEIFALENVINESLAIVESSLKYHHINLEKKIQNNFNICGYKSELLQVLLVILNNAKDVLIQNKIEYPKILVHLYSNDESIFIDMIDNGGGIDEKNINKIFEPYFTTKHKAQGTGLGLYISKIIVEQGMQGKLEVENIYEGACFRIKFNKDINE